MDSFAEQLDFFVATVGGCWRPLSAVTPTHPTSPTAMSHEGTGWGDRAGVDREGSWVPEQDQLDQPEALVVRRRGPLGRGLAASERSLIVADVVTNLQILKPSRKKLRAGDLFAMQFPDDRFLFGRVVTTEARIGPMEGVILIYVYRSRFDSMEVPERSALSAGELLVSPMMTNRLPWSRGYFETVAHWPLEPGDVLSQHCFLSAALGRYFDELGNELPGPVEPVGDRGLHSFRTIADAISDALGFERAPD